jgi:hypothetical protein
MELAIIVWLYAVGLAIAYSLLHEITDSWQGVAIVICWPVLVPLAFVAKHLGWLERIAISAAMKHGDRRGQR